jgi:hypothetical protein
VDLVLAVCCICTCKDGLCGVLDYICLSISRKWAIVKTLKVFQELLGKELPTLPFTSLIRWMNGPWNFDVLKDMLDRDIHVEFHIIGYTGTCARII